jgi:hypothetical protein
LGEKILEEDLDRLLASIRAACPDAALHIGGGEPLINRRRLLHVLNRLRERGLFLEYVETNGFWAERPAARDLLSEVKRKGSACMLLSISPFHNAFLSCQQNRKAYGMIVDVFGPKGIFPWHPAYYPYLERVDPEQPVPFEEYARHFTQGEMATQLTGIIYLHPAGRACASFAPFLDRRPPEAYLEKQCHRELGSPVSGWTGCLRRALHWRITPS